MNKGEMPTSINEVFKRAMMIKPFKNQNAMIEAIGIQQSFFFKVRRKEKSLSDETARKLAEIAELPIDYVLVMNNMEKCKDVEAKTAYENILKLLEHLHTKNR